MGPTDNVGTDLCYNIYNQTTGTIVKRSAVCLAPTPELCNLSEDENLQNEQLKQKYDQILDKLEAYKNKEIDDIMVEEVLKVQELVRELENG